MKIKKRKHRVHANQVNDAWGIDWDCNTDALDLDDAYRKSGRSVEFLAKHINDDDMKYSNNTCRAACHLICKNHLKGCPPGVATKVMSFLKYLVTDAKWMGEMHKLGDIKSKLLDEAKAAKTLMYHAGTLESELESYSKKNAYAKSFDLKAFASELKSQGFNVQVVG